MEEINKSLKEWQKTRRKLTVKFLSVKETLQDLKIQIKGIKKMQCEVILEMENLENQTGTKEAINSNRIQELEFLRHWTYNRRNRLISKRKWKNLKSP